MEMKSVISAGSRLYAISVGAGWTGLPCGAALGMSGCFFLAAWGRGISPETFDNVGCWKRNGSSPSPRKCLTVDTRTLLKQARLLMGDLALDTSRTGQAQTLGPVVAYPQTPAEWVPGHTSVECFTSPLSGDGTAIRLGGT